MTRLLLSLAIVLLRFALDASMRRYGKTRDDKWRQIALGLMYAETLVRIERDRCRS